MSILTVNKVQQKIIISKSNFDLKFRAIHHAFGCHTQRGWCTGIRRVEPWDKRTLKRHSGADIDCQIRPYKKSKCLGYRLFCQYQHTKAAMTCTTRVIQLILFHCAIDFACPMLSRATCREIRGRSWLLSKTNFDLKFRATHYEFAYHTRRGLRIGTRRVSPWEKSRLTWNCGVDIDCRRRSYKNQKNLKN